MAELLLKSRRASILAEEHRDEQESSEYTAPEAAGIAGWARIDPATNVEPWPQTG